MLTEMEFGGFFSVFHTSGFKFFNNFMQMYYVEGKHPHFSFVLIM